MLELMVLSAAFAMQQAIPPPQTCMGRDASPPLSWNAAPTGTQSLAVLCVDLDAPMGEWVHWVLFNLPANTQQLAEGLPKKALLPNDAIQGVNDFDTVGYSGPCPPPGERHRYRFDVYALDTRLDLNAGARKFDVARAMEGHILAHGKIVGYFSR